MTMLLSLVTCILYLAVPAIKSGNVIHSVVSNVEYSIYYPKLTAKPSQSIEIIHNGTGTIALIYAVNQAESTF